MSNDEDTTSEAGVWVTVANPEGGGTHLRLAKRGQRWVVSDVYVHADEVTAADLQRVPLGQVDLMMNLIPMDPYDLKAVVKFGAYATPLLDDSAELSLADLRAQAEGAPAELQLFELTSEADDHQKLTRPDGSDPDGFYRRVARAYVRYAAQTRAPAVEIAKEAGVPVGTARGWVREARRRGHLPPGRQGKIG